MGMSIRDIGKQIFAIRDLYKVGVRDCSFFPVKFI